MGRKRGADEPVSTPFYLGQSFDDVVAVCKLTGRRAVSDYEIVNQDQFPEGTKVEDMGEMIVRWRLSCGTAIFLRKQRGRDDKGPRVFRIVGMILEDGTHVGETFQDQEESGG